MSGWQTAQAPSCHQGLKSSLVTSKIRPHDMKAYGISMEPTVPLGLKYWLSLWVSFLRVSGVISPVARKWRRVCFDSSPTLLKKCGHWPLTIELKMAASSRPQIPLFLFSPTGLSAFNFAKTEATIVGAKSRNSEACEQPPGDEVFPLPRHVDGRPLSLAPTGPLSAK